MARLGLFFSKSHGKPRVDDRYVLSGIIFINRNGLHWCDALIVYGLHKTLYHRWKRWNDTGIFAGMMAGLVLLAMSLGERLRSTFSEERFRGLFVLLLLALGLNLIRKGLLA